MERAWCAAITVCALARAAAATGFLPARISRFRPSCICALIRLDLGVVWGGHEGDAGATFVVGDDAEMHACADAAKTVFDEVEHHWRTTGAGGKALYEYAEQRANVLGWRLNLDIKGHRVSDFPHAIYKAGNLGDFDASPNPGLWILEIQLAHPTRPFGAFYEDLLV